MIKHAMAFLWMFTTVAFTQMNVELLSNFNPYPTKKYSSLWGYTAADGKEYAILGVEDGTSIINITDPYNPYEAAFIPGPPAPPYHWREMKTLSHYAYIVSEGSGTGEGMQIVDLSYLPDSAVLVNTYTQMFTTAHNIYIDDGYAYVVGVQGGGGMHVLDLSDPVNPAWKSYYIGSGYVHDVYVWNDTAYASCQYTYDLIDLADKSSPALISKSAALPNIYAHSGWLTEDKRYFIAAEEFNVRDLMVWDLADRTTWNLVVPSWQMPGTSPIHNIYIKDQYAHISYYREGYVVLDVSDPLNPTLVGQYNTHNGLGGHYAGAWNCYPYFDSESVIISDMQTGLYILKFLGSQVGVEDEGRDIIPDQFFLYQNYPNPFNPSTEISFVLQRDEFVNISVYNVLGEKTDELINKPLTAGKHSVSFDAFGYPSGIYIASLRTNSITTQIKMTLMK